MTKDKKSDKEKIMETEKVVTEDIMASSAEEVPASGQETPMPAEPPIEPPVPPCAAGSAG